MQQSMHYAGLAERVHRQRVLQPVLYGDVDFDVQPYRLASAPDDRSSLPPWVADRAAILADQRVVELMSTATLLGDVGG